MNGKFGGGNGSSANPYLIEDADDLNAIRNYPSSHFKMVNDINLGNGKYNTGQGWNPIKNFMGFLDGDNHKIINLCINRPSEDFVGFFKSCYGAVQNVTFVDPEVIGHNYVGVVCGYSLACSANGATSSYVGYIYIYIANARVTGNKCVGGFCGAIVLEVNRYFNSMTVNNIFIDCILKSNDAIAYGFGYGASTTICDVYRIGYHERYSMVDRNGVLTNCTKISDAECWSYFNFANVPYSNVYVKLHKDPSITTYYAISNTYSSYSACYADNSEFSPIIASGIEYKNLSNIDYSINILPNINHKLFKKEWKSKLEPLNLNKDSIYFKTKDGYVVYNFTIKEWEVKYKRFTNENSIRIIQNGMNRTDLSKIPVAKLKELQDENNKVKIINCINAHEKIISKVETLDIGKFKEQSNKNVFKTKIKFNKYNDKIMNITRK